MSWELEFELKVLSSYFGESQVQNILNLIQYNQQVPEEYKIIFDIDIQSGSRILEFGFLLNGIQEKKVFALPVIENGPWFSIKAVHMEIQGKVLLRHKKINNNEKF